VYDVSHHIIKISRIWYSKKEKQNNKKWYTVP